VARPTQPVAPAVCRGGKQPTSSSAWGEAVSDWPDPDNPGAPLNPERDGRHWLFDVESNVSFPEFWVAGMGAWAVGDAWTARMVAEMGLHYQGPVLMPAEADALRAENARLREALDTIGFAPSGWGGPDLNECILIARKALEVKP